MSFLKFVDVCSGVGGLSVGLIDAGIIPLAAYDVWKPALEVYRRNIGEHAFEADLRETGALIETISSRAPDIIAGGPPCQEFSSCGKRVEGTRAALTVNFAEVVVAVRPRWVIMENVPRALVPILPQSAQVVGEGRIWPHRDCARRQPMRRAATAEAFLLYRAVGCPRRVPHRRSRERSER
jgi:hypothetical protein